MLRSGRGWAGGQAGQDWGWAEKHRNNFKTKLFCLGLRGRSWGLVGLAGEGAVLARAGVWLAWQGKGLIWLGLASLLLGSDRLRAGWAKAEDAAGQALFGLDHGKARDSWGLAGSKVSY
ncbi:hypothetical protein PPACK8108_LOCUS18227 [Phakopsora pachyrhizi]|uniref:Uncharacterized protein n=1 Tax=Phakopsora pachyrhizi TaxID=170000 RepID=A0AAV0BCT2_PHAPC|nr:hypothetical protein PPACK8108_LOCUS18227 [Phakopsora pachyrhizi]